jgi:hypothetical protein
MASNGSAKSFCIGFTCRLAPDLDQSASFRARQQEEVIAIPTFPSIKRSNCARSGSADDLLQKKPASDLIKGLFTKEEIFKQCQRYELFHQHEQRCREIKVTFCNQFAVRSGIQGQ